MATFFRKLQQKDAEGLALIDALNELLSLFKPAPWAYAGLTLEALKRSGDVPERLALRRARDDEAEAELLLNTAEMNTFTLALFFLCAPGLDNPLKLLVLDDPLQNMDEMTVSSLARGLGKVMRIYPDGWRILALFHGEEDVYRLRDEIRTSVYRLPWVSPATAPAAATHHRRSGGDAWHRAHRASEHRSNCDDAGDCRGGVEWLIHRPVAQFVVRPLQSRLWGRGSGPAGFLAIQSRDARRRSHSRLDSTVVASKEDGIYHRGLGTSQNRTCDDSLGCRELHPPPFQGCRTD